MFFIDVFYFVFLDAGAVFQQDGREFAGGGSAIDLSFKPIPDELGNKAAVVDVGVGKNEYAHFGRVEAPVAVENVGLGAEPLEHPAVEEVFPTVIEGEKMFATGDGTGGAVESDFHFFTLKDQVMKNSAT